MVQRSLKLINIHYEQGSRKEKAFTFQNIYTLLGEKCHLLYLFCVPKVDLLFSWEYCVVRFNFFTIYYWENKIWWVQWFLRLTYGPCGRLVLLSYFTDIHFFWEGGLELANWSLFIVMFSSTQYKKNKTGNAVLAWKK